MDITGSLTDRLLQHSPYDLYNRCIVYFCVGCTLFFLSQLIRMLQLILGCSLHRLLLTKHTVNLHGDLGGRCKIRHNLHTCDQADIINRRQIHGIRHGNLKDIGIILIYGKGYQFIFLHDILRYQTDRSILQSLLPEVY